MYRTKPQFHGPNHRTPQELACRVYSRYTVLCLPLGIVGIINAAKVNGAFDAGDMGGAMKASADAKKWTKLAFIIGLVLNVVGGIAYFFMVKKAMEAGMDPQNMEGY